MTASTSEDIVRRATVAFNAGQPDEAQRLCEKGLEQKPGDPMLGHLRFVLGDRSPQEATMNLGMQRLDAPVEDLGSAGEVADLAHVNAGRVERLGRAARRQDLEPLFRQTARELDEPGLVGDRDQSADRFRTYI